MPIKRITFDNIAISMERETSRRKASPAMIHGLKEMVGAGFICKNVREIEFNNVKIIATRQGPALRAENVEDIKINGLDIEKPLSDSSAMEFKKCKERRHK